MEIGQIKVKEDVAVQIGNTQSQAYSYEIKIDVQRCFRKKISLIICISWLQMVLIRLKYVKVH